MTKTAAERAGDICGVIASAVLFFLLVLPLFIKFV